MQFNVFRKWEFSWFLFPSHFWIRDFRFPFFFFSKPGECNVKNLTSENRRKLIRWASKIRNQNCSWKKGHRQVIENSRQYLSEQIFYRKQSFGAFVLWHLACTLTTRIQSSGICWNSHRLPIRSSDEYQLQFSGNWLLFQHMSELNRRTKSTSIRIQSFFFFSISASVTRNGKWNNCKFWRRSARIYLFIYLFIIFPQ